MNNLHQKEWSITHKLLQKTQNTQNLDLSKFFANFTHITSLVAALQLYQSGGVETEAGPAQRIN